MRRLRLVLCAASLVFLLRPAGVARSSSPSFNLVVNQRNSVASLSTSDVKRLVSGGRKLWDGGVVVQLGIIPSEAPETQFLASLVDSSVRELLNLIQQQVFKGELRRPVVLRSSPDCVALAASNAGAFCVAASNVSVAYGARVVPLQ